MSKRRPAKVASPSVPPSVKPSLLSLRARWAELFGTPAPPTFRHPMLMRGIAWKEEVLANGDLSPATLKRLAGIAAECRERRLKSRETGKPVRAMTEPPNQLKKGARLVKIWRGETYVVDVSGEGYHWNGEVFASLSAAAKAITGTHWNGPLFFGLTKRPPYDRDNPKSGRRRRAAAPEREAA